MNCHWSPISHIVRRWAEMTLLHVNICLKLRWSPIPHTVCRWAEKALGRLHICTEYQNFCWSPIPRTFCRCEEMALVRLQICTYLSKPSLVIYTSHRLYMSKKSMVRCYCAHTFYRFAEKLWWDFTYAQTHLKLRWPSIPHKISKERSGEI